MKLLSKGLAVLAVLALMGSSMAGAEGPQLQVVSPVSGAAVPRHPQLGLAVMFELNVKNFKLPDCTKGTAPDFGEGHIHSQLDDRPVQLHICDTKWIFYGRLTPAEHTFIVELRGTNHRPLNPPVKQTVTFTMTEK